MLDSAVLKLREDGILQRLYKKWYLTADPNCKSDGYGFEVIKTHENLYR